MAHTQTPRKMERSSTGGFTYAGTILISLTVMMIAMTIDALPDKEIGYFSAASLVVVALFMALKVRVTDLTAALWSPMLVWFGALMTAGQIARPRAGSTKERELVLILHGLADHAWWILGATALAAVVVAIRRFR